MNCVLDPFEDQVRILEFVRGKLPTADFPFDQFPFTLERPKDAGGRGEFEKIFVRLVTSPAMTVLPLAVGATIRGRLLPAARLASTSAMTFN